MNEKDREKTFKWNIIPFICGLIIYAFLSSMITTTGLFEHNREINMIFRFILIAFMVIYFSFFFFKSNKISKSDYLFFEKIPKNLILKIIGFIISGYLFTVFVMNVVPKILNVDPELSSQFAKDLLDRSIFSHFELILFIGIIIPIVEEILFRGVLFRSFERKIGTVYSLIISSVIFASLHFIFDIPSIFFVGMYLGILYITTRNIFYPVIIHIFNNTLFCLSIIYGFEAGSSSFFSSPVFGIFFLVLSILFLFLLKFKKFLTPMPGLKNKEHIALFVYSLLTLIALTILILTLGKSQIMAVSFVLLILLAIAFFILKNPAFKISLIALTLIVFILPYFHKKEGFILKTYPLPGSYFSSVIYEDYLRTKQDDKILIYKIHSPENIEFLYSIRLENKNDFAYFEAGRLIVKKRNKRSYYNIATGEFIKEEEVKKTPLKIIHESENTVFTKTRTEIISEINGDTFSMKINIGDSVFFNNEGKVFLLAEYKKYSSGASIHSWDNLSVIDNRMNIIEQYKNVSVVETKEDSTKWTKYFYYPVKDKLVFFDIKGEFVKELILPEKQEIITAGTIFPYERNKILLHTNKGVWIHDDEFHFLKIKKPKYSFVFFQDNNLAFLNDSKILYSRLYVYDTINRSLMSKTIFPSAFFTHGGNINGLDYFIMYSINNPDNQLVRIETIKY